MCDHCGCETTHHHHHEGKTISVEQDVLAHDKAHAESLRTKLKDMDVRMINVIGSPGCGKTQLLSALIPLLSDKHKAIVIEGDLATDNDAKRIEATGAPVYQVQTGTACHLTAHDVEHALEHLPLEHGGLVIIENVGNLVCPSMFDIGENLRMVCLSVTEGTDKPQKYPVSFREADLAVITKTDLSPYVNFDTNKCLGMIKDIKPELDSVLTSATDKSGLKDLSNRILNLWNQK